MRSKGLSKLKKAFFISLAVMGSSLFAQDYRNEEQVIQLFKESQELYGQGKYVQSESKLKAIIQLNPTIELINKLYRQTSDAYWAKLLSNENTKKVAQRLDVFRWSWEKKRRRSKDFIVAQVKRLGSNDPDVVRRAQVELYNIGHFAVPHMVEHLKDPLTEDTMRTLVNVTLQGMVNGHDGEGVLPLLELLDSDDSLLLENVAIILGASKDKRALAPLKKVLERDTISPAVRSFVTYALTVINDGKDIKKDLKLAKELYYDKALRYLLNDHSVIRESDVSEGVTYRYKAGDKIEPLNIMEQNDPKFGIPEVAKYAWHLYMAEESIYDAFKLDPAFEKGIPLLLCVYYAQFNQVEGKLKDIDRLIEAQIVTEDEKNELKTRKERLVSVQVIGQLANKENLYAALDLALKNNLNHVAVTIIEHLKYVTDGSEITENTNTIETEVIEPENEASETDDKKKIAKDEAENADADGEVKEKKEENKVEDNKAENKEEVVAEAKEDADAPAEKADDEVAKKDENKEAEDDTADQKAEDKEAEKSDEALVVEEEIVVDDDVLAAPLFRALEYADERVNYEAAMTLAYLNPNGKFPGYKKVVALLAKAIGEKDQIAMLVIDSSNQRNIKVTNNLRDCGFLVASSETGLGGIMYSRGFPSKDIIVIAGDLKGRNAERVFGDLRADYRTKNTPIAILVDEVDKVRMAEKFVHLTEFIITPKDNRDTLLEKVRQIHASAPTPASAKREKEHVAILAANALANIKPKDTVFLLEDCYESCEVVLTPPERIDEIRLPVLKALANFKALPPLKIVCDTYIKEVNKKDIRLAALYAIGEINPNDEYAYKKALLPAIEMSNDLDYRIEGSEAIGKAKKGAEETIRNLVHQRIKKELK